MTYEVLLDDFLGKLSDAGIDITELEIIDEDITEEYTEMSKNDKKISYIKNETASESDSKGFTSCLFI